MFLQNTLAEITAKGLRYCGDVCKTLLKSVRVRLTCFLQSTDHRIASVLDPRFKCTWVPEEEIEDLRKQ